MTTSKISQLQPFTGAFNGTEQFELASQNLSYALTALNFYKSIAPLPNVGNPVPLTQFQIPVFNTQSLQCGSVTLDQINVTHGNVPAGGTIGQILVKNSGTDYDTGWSTLTVPTTSAAGTLLASGTANTITATSTPTLGVAGSVLGTITLAGNTSGSTKIQPIAAASGTLTLPAATDTLVGRATTDTLTNKTLTSPTLVTPVIGVATGTSLSVTGALVSTGTAGVGYATGAGGIVTQITSRTTGVTLNTLTGAITMFSAAGSATAASFTVTNSTVGANDTIRLNQKSGTNLYSFLVTAISAGSFNITFFTTGGTATDAPVINFTVFKGAVS